MRAAEVLCLIVLVCIGSACNKNTDPRASAEETQTKETRSQSGAQLPFGGLTCVPPPGYVLADESSEELPSIVPDAPRVREEFRSYNAPAGNSILLFRWTGTPSRDRGAMVVEKKWDAVVGGQPARVSLTSQFFGTPQRVLTAHFKSSQGDSYLIYMKTADPEKAPDRESFMSFLGTCAFASGSSSEAKR